MDTYITLMIFSSRCTDLGKTLRQVFQCGSTEGLFKHLMADSKDPASDWWEEHLEDDPKQAEVDRVCMIASLDELLDSTIFQAYKHGSRILLDWKVNLYVSEGKIFQSLCMYLNDRAEKDSFMVSTYQSHCPDSD